MKKNGQERDRTALESSERVYDATTTNRRRRSQEIYEWRWNSKRICSVCGILLLHALCVKMCQNVSLPGEKVHQTWNSNYADECTVTAKNLTTTVLVIVFDISTVLIGCCCTSRSTHDYALQYRLAVVLGGGRGLRWRGCFMPALCAAATGNAQWPRLVYDEIALSQTQCERRHNTT